MADYSIGITTFSKRLDIVSSLIDSVRLFSEKDILLVVNGDCKQRFNEEYRSKILTLCLNYKNIYPIFFPEFRSLAKMWNTISIHSSTEHNLFLNDDINITGENVFVYLENLQTIDSIRTINGSFSHFITSKSILEQLKYFDERFLGFGVEDGDMMYRHIEILNMQISNAQIHNIESIMSNEKDSCVATGGHHRYTRFNEEFGFGSYGPKYTPIDPPIIVTSFVPHQKRILNDEDQYPYERFFRENKHKL